ncbi:MAG: hypothetical protein Q9227_004533 [Pyrenula ochraceoflavens]
MDPLSAFSLAGTVLQFIDCGSRFIKLAYKLYRSEDDGLSSYSEMEELTLSFSDALKIFQAPNSDRNLSAAPHDDLAKLANECKEVAEQLITLLQELNTSTSRKRDAVKRAFQIRWKEDEIRSLKSRLDEFRNQFNFHVLASMRTLSDVSEIKASLRRDLKAKIYEEASRSVNTTAPLIVLEPWQREELVKAVLSTLAFQGMANREERIAETYESTFKWVFQESDTDHRKWESLKNWLESESQIYWITGKAGSGKSTLMKYICQPTLRESDSRYSVSDSLTAKACQPRCQQYLETWAGRKKLLVASFYFWNSGTQLQMARAGLLRSLLYQIMHQAPDLMPTVFPSQWESFSILGMRPNDWEESELHTALELVVKTLPTRYKIAFFIDGLDEFAGTKEELISLVQNLARWCADIKFCVASRPWVVFETAFETKPQLRLENLTYNDIKHYVASNFESNLEFPKLQAREPEFASQLIENVVTKASGVFLWVNLVVASLLAGINFGDRVQDLQRRLDHLPPDLEHLYDKMLRGLDPFYLEHAAQLIMILEASIRPLTLIILYFADEERVDSVLETPPKLMLGNSLPLHMDAMVRRLNSRLKGLLEVDNNVAIRGPEELAQRTVQYLHRTVKDFIQSSEVQKFLQSSLNSSFDPHLKLCVAYAAYMKAFPTRIDSKILGNSPDDALQSLTPISLRFPRDECLFHAAGVASINERCMVQVLDYLRYSPSVLLLSARTLDFSASSRGAVVPLENLLSLAVVSGVTEYVKARAELGCLVQRFNKDGTFIDWPLLLDAIDDKAHPKMVQCLLDLKADANYVAPDLPEYNSRRTTPWIAYLDSFRFSSSRTRQWKNDQYRWEVDFRLIAEPMVKSGADMGAPWASFAEAFVQESLYSNSKSKADEHRAHLARIFSDLKKLQPTPKGKKKWYHKLRRS